MVLILIKSYLAVKNAFPKYIEEGSEENHRIYSDDTDGLSNLMQPINYK